MEFELYKGLPLRTINTYDLDGNEVTFGVTTETVNTLISDYLNNREFSDGSSDDDLMTIEEFDNSFSYCVPEDVFTTHDDTTLIMFINTNIDNNFKLV